MFYLMSLGRRLVREQIVRRVACRRRSAGDVCPNVLTPRFRPKKGCRHEPQSGAVESGRGTAEFEGAIKRLPGEQRVSESPMKDVSGTRGIKYLNLKSGTVVKSRIAPGENTIPAECGGNHATSKSRRNCGKGLGEVRDAHKPREGNSREQIRKSTYSSKA